MLKPILFNTEMVRAILDGRKTETRRVIKPQPKMRLCYVFAGDGKLRWNYPSEGTWEFWGEEFKRPESFTEDDAGKLWTPPCHTDDILYIRETWSKLSGQETERFVYKATDSYPFGEKYIAKFKWHPSIHMPKEAARIFLKVTDVRVERLQDMPHDAALKEGIHFCECPDGYTWRPHTNIHNCYISPMGAMKALWDSTVKKSDIDLYGWDANPYVWVITFERIDKEVAYADRTN